MMVVLRHLNGSDPHIEIADEEHGGNAVATLHFEPRPLKAARSIEHDTRSVVVSDRQLVKNVNVGEPADVTQVTRSRGNARWLTLSHWIILLESNWVVFVVGLSALILLICAFRLRHL
jgi:hypothetical protein